MLNVLIPSNRIMLTKQLTASAKSKCYTKRKSSLLVSLLQDRYSCAADNSKISMNRTKKGLSVVSDEIQKQEQHRWQNRKAAKHLKQKRQSIENDLCKEIQTLEKQYRDLQDEIAELKQRKQNLLYNLNEQSFIQIDKLLSDDESDFETFLQSDLPNDLYDQSSKFDISSVI